MNARPLPCEGSALPLSYSPIVREKWSGKRDSNPRPTAWKAIALPTELFPPATQSILSPMRRIVKQKFSPFQTFFAGAAAQQVRRHLPAFSARRRRPRRPSRRPPLLGGLSARGLCRVLRGFRRRLLRRRFFRARASRGRARARIPRRRGILFFSPDFRTGSRGGS